MRKLVKACIAAGACLLLTGCGGIVVKSVTGIVSAPQLVGGMSMKRERKAIQGGNAVSVGDWVEVETGSSVTLTLPSTTAGETCDITYRTSFIVVPGPVDCDEEQKKQDEKARQEEEQKTSQEQQDQNPSSNEGENGANGTEGSSGIKAPQVTPTSPPQYPGAGGGGGGGGSGIGGPQVIASGVPQYNAGGIVQTGTQLLEAALGIYATKKIGDNLDDDDHKGNSEGQPISP